MTIYILIDETDDPTVLGAYNTRLAALQAKPDDLTYYSIQETTLK